MFISKKPTNNNHISSYFKIYNSYTKITQLNIFESQFK